MSTATLTVEKTALVSRETELAELLSDLAQVQEDLLGIIADKRERMVAQDTEGMADMQERESAVLARLEQCHARRAEMLDQAAAEGLPATSIRELAATLPESKQDRLNPQIKESSARMRLLQHHSLTNWVLAQRTLLHLSQMLEIIATGGRLRPTYGKEDSSPSGGALVDQEV